MVQYFNVSSASLTARSGPVRIKVRIADQLFIARGDICEAKITQLPDAEISTGKGADDIAMHHSTFEIVNRIATILFRLRSREIAKKPTSKGITSPRRIYDLF